MKLNLKKSLFVLLMSTTSISLTSCSLNSIKTTNNKEVNSDNDLFKGIGLSNNIIKNDEFINAINLIKEYGYNLEIDELLNNEKIIAIKDTNNNEVGLIAKGKSNNQVSIDCSFNDSSIYDSYTINYIYDLSNQEMPYSIVTYEYYYNNNNEFNTYSKIYINNELKRQSIQIEEDNGSCFYIGLDKDNTSFTLNEVEYEIDNNSFDNFFNKMQDCEKDHDLSKYIDFITKDVDEDKDETYNVNALVAMAR